MPYTMPSVHQIPRHAILVSFLILRSLCLHDHICSVSMYYFLSLVWGGKLKNSCEPTPTLSSLSNYTTLRTKLFFCLLASHFKTDYIFGIRGQMPSELVVKKKILGVRGQNFCWGVPTFTFLEVSCYKFPKQVWSSISSNSATSGL